MGKTYINGLKMVLLTVIISGFAVFINKFAGAGWTSSSVFTTSRNIITALLLIASLIIFKKYPELKNLSKKNWVKLIIIGFIGGAVPFLMFFKALTLISAPEAALLHKTLFLWVALFSIPFLKEKISYWQVAGLLVFASAIIMPGIPGEWSFGAGFWLALGAAVLWAIENIISKITLRELSALVVGWGRMFFGSLFLLTFVALQGQTQSLVPSSMTQTVWMLASGIILFGYVWTWYQALKNIPATVASSILVAAAPITIILNSIFITKAFPANAVFPSALMILGVLLISKQLETFYSKYIQKRTVESL